MPEELPPGPWMRGRKRHKPAPQAEPSPPAELESGSPGQQTPRPEGPGPRHGAESVAEQPSDPDSAGPVAEHGAESAAEPPSRPDSASDSPASGVDAPLAATRPAAKGFAPWLRGRRRAAPEEPEHAPAEAEPGPDACAPPRAAEGAQGEAATGVEERTRAEGPGAEQPAAEPSLVASAGAALGDPSRDPAPEAPVSRERRPERKPRRPRPERKPRKPPGERKDDALFARIRPFQERERKSQGGELRVVEGGRPSTRFRLESDDVGLVLKSGPSDKLKLQVAVGVGGLLLLGLISTGFGIAELVASPPALNTLFLGGLPNTFSCGCVTSLFALFGALPCIVALRRGVHLVIDTGPGRARYKGPSGDLEFPVSFITGMRAESAAMARSVCLHVRGRGALFLFYSTRLDEVSRVREALSVAVPHMRGKHS